MTPHTMPGPIVFHCKSTQVRNGGKIEILEELERLRHNVRNTKRGETTFLQASGGVAVRARQLGDFLPFRLTLASHEESLMHPLTKFLFHILASTKMGLLLFCQGPGVFAAAMF